jgi:alkylhydroperoxidase family enzyme
MLEYVARLTQAPAGIGPADIETLRGAGFDDRAIHDICSIAAYYAFVNRIADGLGVELEPRFSSQPRGP